MLASHGFFLLLQFTQMTRLKDYLLRPQRQKVDFMISKSECMFILHTCPKESNFPMISTAPGLWSPELFVTSFIENVHGCIPNWLSIQKFYCCAYLQLRLETGSLLWMLTKASPPTLFLSYSSRTRTKTNS